MESYFELGPYTRSITTKSAEAEIWFNRGLNWCYAFHHKEAIRCFKKAIELDPTCVMCYWGVAYATGPYYNIPWEKMSPSGRPEAIKICYEYSQKAKELCETTPLLEVEKVLCDALAVDFKPTKQTKLRNLKSGTMIMPMQCDLYIGIFLTIMMFVH